MATQKTAKGKKAKKAKKVKVSAQILTVNQAVKLLQLRRSDGSPSKWTITALQDGDGELSGTLKEYSI